MAPADNSIFRKAALERLQNPERLDHLMQVTTVRGWIVLTGIGVVLMATLIWGVFGVSPENVQVLGIMLREGGVFEVQSLGTGPVTELRTPAGTRVREGDVVAHVAQPALELNIARVEAQLASVRRNRTVVVASLDTTTRVDLAAIESQRQQARSNLEVAEARIAYLESRADALDSALVRKLITPDVVQNNVAALAQARDALKSAQSALAQAPGRTVTTRTQAEQQVFTLDQQIHDIEATLRALREQLRQEGTIFSPFNGTILEELVDLGEAVNPGKAVVALELDHLPLELYLFTPEGKRITPDMIVKVVPAGISPEEWGYVIGDVLDVSQAPLGTTAMNRYLRNDALVRNFLGTTGAYLVRVDVERDSTTFSGFRWTSGAGPHLQFGSGTLLSGSITVEERPPITLVIPALKKWMGM
jgi:HlyD family secretion protein